MLIYKNLNQKKKGCDKIIVYYWRYFLEFWLLRNLAPIISEKIKFKFKITYTVNNVSRLFL